MWEALFIGAAWLWLQAPVLEWIGHTLTRDDLRFNAVLFVLAGVAAARSVDATTFTRPRLGALPVAVALGFASAEVVLARTVDVDILQTALAGIATWGLAGLFVTRATWWRLLPFALLLVAVLPFGGFLEIYLGFPARLAAADLVSHGLAQLGIASLPSDAVLALDTPAGPGAASVDLPCAGLRSLWSGTIFLLTGAAMMRGRLDLATALAGIVLYPLLFVANVARIAALVLLGLHFGDSHAAAIVHAPLGVIGFTASIAVAGAILHVAPRPPAKAPLIEQPTSPTNVRGLLALGATLLVLGALHVPVALAARPLEVQVVAPFPVSELALSDQEVAFFQGVGVAPPVKWAFDGGSVLIAPSRSWRAHHLPEQCLLGAGRTIESSTTALINAGFPVHVATLDGGDTAIWWYQAPGRVTDDLAKRIWADVRGDEDRWVMVSLVLHGRGDPLASPALPALRDAVAAAFATDGAPS